MLEIFDELTTKAESFPSSLQQQAVAALEKGKVLYFPNLGFQCLDQEKKFLSPYYSNTKDKNISFDSLRSKIKGVNAPLLEQNQLQDMIERFSQQAKNLVHNLFPRYIAALQPGRTSFRPVEIKDRKMSYRKDDTRLHVDAFPSSPNQGKRILRVFSNINPDNQARVWRLGEPFEEVVCKFLPRVRRVFPGSSTLLQVLRITKTKRTPYDHIMLQIHDSMKLDLHYQATVSQMEFKFPAGCSWIVMTDHVSHAAMSGQHALEQTFYLPVAAMQHESLSPLRILEKFTSRKLV